MQQAYIRGCGLGAPPPLECRLSELCVKTLHVPLWRDNGSNPTALPPHALEQASTPANRRSRSHSSQLWHWGTCKGGTGPEASPHR